ncbi:hypothetical protein [Actinomadura hibisca]|uniref:hypothetical protein n=1 Tax=Actinomadura hibisca TaxID=68565 RepID=UPI000A881A19|nr:hypothetical protein [Actinomadura hibisca]
MIPNAHRRKGGGAVLGAARPGLSGPYGPSALHGNDADGGQEAGESEFEQHSDSMDEMPPP